LRTETAATQTLVGPHAVIPSLFKAADFDEAVRIATDDPSVKSGMLNVTVKTFWVPFHA